jgi:hypothetical protein
MVVGGAYATLGIFTDVFFKEVGFSLQGDGDHPFERVLGGEQTGLTKVNKEAVGTELHILTHQVGIHADEGNREGLLDAIAFDGDGILDDCADMARRGRVQSLVWRRHVNSTHSGVLHLD